MFDNVAFEVAIGLVFVYLLYSLLITILGEMIATWMGLRARILRTAIERMLNDGYYKEIEKQKWLVADFAFKAWYWITNKIRHFFLYESKAFKSSFAGRFYSNPSIKYLTRLEADQKIFFENTKPAYITPENFASTLINFLSDKGNGSNKLEQLRFCLKYNTLHIQPETAKNIRTILNNSGNDVNLFKERLINWFDETMDRATGWYKRKIRFILFWLGFFLALSFNVDSIKIARILANDKDARNQLVSMGVSLAKDSARYSSFVDKNGDTVHAKEILDSGYSHITKDISQANLVLGLGWDFSKLTKNDSIEIDSNKHSRLYKETKKFEEFNTLRINRNQLQKAISNSAFRSDTFYQRAITLQNSLTLDSLSFLMNKNPDFKNDSVPLKSIRDSLQATHNSIMLLTAALSRDSGVTRGYNNFLKHADAPIRLATGNRLSEFDSVKQRNNKPVLVIYGKRYATVPEKISFIIDNIFSQASRLLGIILTAFALSLGAPFWFGILNKLASLRSAGVKPDGEKDEDKNIDMSNHPVQSFPTANTLIPEIIKADPAEIAMDMFTLRIKDEPGIVAIGLAPEDGNPSAVISVMAESEEVKNYLLKKYGKKEEIENKALFKSNFSIAVKYSVQNTNTVHAGAIKEQRNEVAGNEIANISKALGSGTLGCFLIKKGSDKLYMLSCWHVMKDNANWETAIIKHEIIDSTKTTIGLVENGCLADTIDVGIAVCSKEIAVLNTNGMFSVTAQQREVKAFDALVSTPVQLFGKVCQYTTATIFHHKMNARIKYPDGRMHLLQDVFTITKDMRSPTTGGDSGAVVTDMDGVPLGMVIGGNGTFSYVVKFTNMFDENKLYNEYSFLV